MNAHGGSRELREMLEADSSPATVVVADPGSGDEWGQIRGQLLAAYRVSKEAAAAGRAVVYVVDGDDLLGRNGAGRAMIATGLLSAARTLALEMARQEVPVNVLAVEAATSPEAIVGWCRILAGRGGPSGELVRLGTGHLGKALP
jgi:hypothetical protein